MQTRSSQSMWRSTLQFFLLPCFLLVAVIDARSVIVI